LAENQDGLSGVLQIFVEGKMKKIGLEHLIYLENFRQQFYLGILSTMPQYYLKKLGFETIV